MDIYYDESRTYSTARLHPYTASSSDQSGYIDLKEKPESIETILEDFRPFAGQVAVQTFYSFLRWINGPNSHLETNDSAFRPPGPNKDKNSDLALVAHGRFFVLYRDLRLNTFETQSKWLCGKLMQILSDTDPEFPARQGVVGFTQNPCLQLKISNATPLPEGFYDYAADDPGLGKHLMLSFWGYGNNEAEVFNNLNRVFRNIWTACENLSNEITKVIGEPPHVPRTNDAANNMKAG